MENGWVERKSYFGVKKVDVQLEHGEYKSKAIFVRGGVYNVFGSHEFKVGISQYHFLSNII